MLQCPTNKYNILGFQNIILHREVDVAKRTKKDLGVLSLFIHCWTRGGLEQRCKTVVIVQVQGLEDTLQNANLQMSRIKSDLRGTQQEKEALKQEVIALQKQLQNAAGDKVISFLFY